MSLKTLAQQTLARLHSVEMGPETPNETGMKQVKHTPVSCFTDAHACFTSMKHAEPRETAISEPCFIVSFPSDETHETKQPGSALAGIWQDGLASLDPDTPRHGILPDRWRRMLLDGDAFLTDWGEQAASLGWTADNLFACPPRYCRRLDLDGLVTGLQGRLVVLMTDCHAMIDAGDGRLWRHERRPRPGAVLWWYG